MTEETNFIPRKVTNPNDFLDRKSYLSEMANRDILEDFEIHSYC